VYVCQRERDGANADCGICIQSGASEMEAVTNVDCNPKKKDRKYSKTCNFYELRGQKVLSREMIFGENDLMRNPLVKFIKIQTKLTFERKDIKLYFLFFSRGMKVYFSILFNPFWDNKCYRPLSIKSFILLSLLRKNLIKALRTNS